MRYIEVNKAQFLKKFHHYNGAQIPAHFIQSDGISG